MESRAHALAAGIFTLLLALAGALAVWWLSGKREATREYLLVTRGSVTGLNPQAQVRYRGIRAGKVLNMEIDPKDARNILVRIGVDADLPVTKATTARLDYQGVTGLAYVQLEDAGVSREALNGEGDEPPRIALESSSFESLTAAALESVKLLRQVAERANALLSDENVKRVGQTIAHLDEASMRVSGSLREAPQAVAALRQALSDENLKRLSATLAQLEKASAEAAPLAAQMRDLVASLQGLSKKLDGISGDAGGELAQTTLPRVNQLLQELASSSRRMSRLLEQIEESPNVLIFGRGAPRPGPGEPGFRP